ncbi:MAG: TetR/AcrR family transcriptional regulator [Rhodomicrobium sp.]
MVPKVTPPASPLLKDGPGLKTRLITEARDLLERDGIAALTLRAAARKAGVSHMAPYRHFTDKDDLLAAVAEQGFRELTEFMDRAVALHGTPLAGGVAYVSFALENPALYKLMFGTGLASPHRFPGLVAAGAQAFQRCVEASRAKGAGTGGDEVPDAAIALWAIVHGLASLAADGLVTLPPPGSEREKRIAAILDAAS